MKKITAFLGMGAMAGMLCTTPAEAKGVEVGEDAGTGARIEMAGMQDTKGRFTREQCRDWLETAIVMLQKSGREDVVDMMLMAPQELIDEDIQREGRSECVGMHPRDVLLRKVLRDFLRK